MDALMFVRRVIMKTRLFKWLLTATVLFCLSFVVTNAIAKKPPPKDDPCLSQQSFTPDFAFYRDTGKGKVRTFTFFVADTENGCEIKLVDFTRQEGLIHALSFSSTKEDDGTYLGRIVWRTNLSPGNFRAVWGYDFSINGTDVGNIRGPYRVMDNYEDTSKNITSMDLSPDRKTLAYHFYISGADSSIRMVNIDACVGNNACTLDSVNGLVLAEPNLPQAEYLGSPAWGPLGERVYYRRGSGYQVEPEFFKLQYVDLPEGWNGDWSELESFEPAESTLVSTLEQPDFPRISGMASGIIDEGEILTVKIPTDSGCGYISFIDVATCEEPGNECLVEPKFFGVNPSLTRQGNVIHIYYRESAPMCYGWGGTVGSYDGTEVTKVLNGFKPDAAGGFPWQ